MSIFCYRFLKDLEEEVLNDDSYIWKEESEPQMETNVPVAPSSSPQSTNDTRSVNLL